ncbi:LacI family DNA-binding transcriptional regulator [Streptomyces echinoruber]|uniref:LacI family transcriptional regulator n=1 Tax=Streptomyces echinoruber TaxID=68898 RepID=A0A918RSF2_9ACTN|nr:LacI family DNA-binding transcriptional regulator [Streptomyces echinoruber]GHA07542.1 LacI family transcriptional regulator [Streptomyces echinoruber]
MAASPAKPPTIRDVAERAGVSKSLVSLVLRGSGRVRPEKRQAVLRAMRELGYRPNAAARSLSERRSLPRALASTRAGRTPLVGVVLDDLRNPWFVDLLDGLNSLLHASGVHMLLADARLGRRTGQDPAGPFLDLGADGLVVVGTLPDPTALAPVAARLPVVVAGAREPVLPGVDVVCGDDERGARLATEHLVGLGHRRIAHVAGTGAVGELRRRGFEAALRAHGLADLARVEPGDLTEEGGHRAAVRLLARPERPTAVLAVNDIAAVGVMSAAEELGLRVPHDVSVAGYDNTGVSRLRHLWLTTVDTAPQEVGRRAARCLLDRLDGRGGPGRVHLAAPALEVRGTTAPPPGD